MQRGGAAAGVDPGSRFRILCDELSSEDPGPRRPTPYPTAALETSTARIEPPGHSDDGSTSCSGSDRASDGGGLRVRTAVAAVSRSQRRGDERSDHHSDHLDHGGLQLASEAAGRGTVLAGGVGRADLRHLGNRRRDAIHPLLEHIGRRADLETAVPFPDIREECTDRLRLCHTGVGREAGLHGLGHAGALRRAVARSRKRPGLVAPRPRALSVAARIRLVAHRLGRHGRY